MCFEFAATATNQKLRAQTPKLHPQQPQHRLLNILVIK